MEMLTGSVMVNGTAFGSRDLTAETAIYERQPYRRVFTTAAIGLVMVVVYVLGQGLGIW